MSIEEGYLYHIKDDFFNKVNDKYLMQNKENDKYRPNFYALKDVKNPDIYWMIPISSQIEKFQRIIDYKIKKYGKCNTIIIGNVAGNQSAFLIQNAFPVIEKYIDHIHIIENNPIKIHNELEKKLKSNLMSIIALNNRGIKLTFTDITYIKKLMEEELNNK